MSWCRPGLQAFEPFRHRGYAGEALSADEPFACHQGARRLGLNVGDSDAAAVALSQRAEYRPVHHDLKKPLPGEAPP